MTYQTSGIQTLVLPKGTYLIDSGSESIIGSGNNPIVSDSIQPSDLAIYNNQGPGLHGQTMLRTETQPAKDYSIAEVVNNNVGAAGLTSLLFLGMFAYAVSSQKFGSNKK